MYIRSIKRNRVVPHQWIKDVSQHLESFINNGLNNNQTSSVFWTDRTDAFDENGKPKHLFKPNVDAGYGYNFPEEGFYECQLVKFRCNTNLKNS